MDGDGHNEFIDEDIICYNREDDSNHRCILLLIDLYKTYRPKVGGLYVKTLKKMWEIIAEKMNSHGYSFTASKVENKWKVLERNYKKIVDNNNKTGRAHKVFPYQQQFDEIYKQKVSIHPKLLLSAETVIMPARNECPPGPSSSSEVVEATETTLPSISTQDVPNISISTPARKSSDIKKQRKKAVTYHKRNEILKEMKDNLKNFYDQKISLEKEKLDLKKQKLELEQTRLEIIQEHSKELKRFNSIWANKENFPRNPFI